MHERGFVAPGGLSESALEARVDGPSLVDAVQLAGVEAAVLLDGEVAALPLLDLPCGEVVERNRGGVAVQLVAVLPLEGAVMADLMRICALEVQEQAHAV